MSTELTLPESKRLLDLEAVIEKGQGAFWAVGAALLKIRDERLYRIEFPTFKAYCSTRWGFGSARGYQLIAAAVECEASPEGDTPKSERDARRRIKERREPQKECLPVVDIDKPRVHTELAPLSDDEKWIKSAEDIGGLIRRVRMLLEEELLLGNRDWLRMLADEHDDSARQLRARAEEL